MDATISKQTVNDLIVAINMRVNYIQTGNIALSADDAANAGKSHLIKPLDEEQMRLILRLKDLVRELQNGTTNNVRLISV